VSLRLDLDPDSPLPLYAQVIAQIRRALATGALKPGAQLPTVRQLAVNLRINPNTVARAYAELERAGLIATRQGRGTFVNERPPPSVPEEERAARLAALLHDAIGEAAALGYRPEEFLEEVRAHVRARKGDA
jgi:GntR family transcriptional regulator